MTVLSEDFSISLMQSFQKEKLYDNSKCGGYSNKVDNSGKNTMVMNVGTSGNQSMATTAPSASASTSSSSSITINNNSNNNNSNNNSNRPMGKRTGKRPGRKPAKIDERAKLERSRQSAKECRARKKLRYQYLEELVLNREKAVFSLREELEMLKQWCIQLDSGKIPAGLIKVMASQDMAQQRRQAQEMKRAAEIQKQQRQQQLQIQHVHQRDLPSTSAVFISSNSSSSSSSASSSPSPPQASGIGASQVVYQQQQQQQQGQNQQPFSQPKGVVMSSQPPPPPYPGLGAKMPMRFGLTRQMAFDDSAGASSYRSQQYPQQQKQHMAVSSSSLHRQFSGAQPQTNPQQHASLPASNTPTSLHPTSPSLPYFSQNTSTQQSSSSLSSSSTSHQTDNMLTSSIDHVTVSMPVSTSAYLDDISDLISKESRNHRGQFTMASSTSKQYSGISSTQSSRVRSLSNPAAMGFMHRPQQQPFVGIDRNSSMQPRRSASFTNKTHLIPDNYPAVSRKRHITSDASLSFINEFDTPNESVNVKREVGLFSGVPIDIPPTISDGDSDSSDYNPNISRLFQSSSSSVSVSTAGQKRTLSDPVIHYIAKKPRSLDTEMDSYLTDFVTYSESDTHLLPYDSSTVKCMGSTGTLNTTSAASPFGFVPRNADSPMTTSSGVTSPAPSCQSGQTNSSPAPQPSFLECSNSSSALSSALMDQDHNLDNVLPVSTPTTESFLFSTSTTTSNPFVCTETGLSATISEPIPEFYSFLADLQADNNLSLPSTPITTPSFSLDPSIPNTSHQSPFANPTPHNKQVQMVPSTSAGVLNVPSILEELSSEEST